MIEKCRTLKYVSFSSTEQQNPIHRYIYMPWHASFCDLRALPLFFLLPPRYITCCMRSRYAATSACIFSSSCDSRSVPGAAPMPASYFHYTEDPIVKHRSKQHPMNNGYWSVYLISSLLFTEQYWKARTTVGRHMSG